MEAAVVSEVAAVGVRVRLVGFVEEVGRRHGVEDPVQMTIGTSDGRSVWAFRYSSERKSRSLFYSTDVRALRELYPDRPRLQEVCDEARIVVSEPLGNLPGVWNELPESSYGVIPPDGELLAGFNVAQLT